MTKSILHVLSQRPSHTGSGTTLDAIVRHANTAGWMQHAVVGTPADDPLPSVGDLSGDRVYPLLFGTSPLDFALPGMSDVMPYASSRFSELTPGQLATYREAWRMHVTDVIARTQPDVIHSHHLWLLSALLKDIAPKIPVVTHCHGTGLRQMELCPHLAAEVIAGCRRNEHFLALHQQQAEQIVEKLGVSCERVSVVGAGYRDAVFHPLGRIENPGPTLVYAGKLSHAKGVPQLLEAVAILRREMPEVTLHIAGSGTGDEAEAITRRIEQLHPHVIWHGQLQPAALANVLRRSAVFVLPSFYEGLPLVVVEAIACECRVVATDLPGVRELAIELGGAIELVPLPPLQSIDQPTAEGIPTFVDQLVQAIGVSLRDDPLRDVNAITRAFTWEEVFRRIEGVWQRVTADA